MESKAKPNKRSRGGDELSVPYHKLFEVAQEGIWVIDKEAKTTLLNPAMAKMLGYTTAEMIGRTLFDFMDDRGVTISKRNIARREQGISEQHDFEFLAKDGTRVVVKMETAPLQDDDGNYAGAVAGIIDITERKRAEEALKKSEDSFRRVFEESPIGMALLDMSGRFTRVNRRMTEMVGYGSAEFARMTFSDITHPEELEISLSATRDLVEGRIRTIDMEKRYVAKSGSTLWGHVTVAAIHDDEGNFMSSLAMLENITDRKQAEEAGQNLELQLRQSQKMEAIGTFAGGIAHDFNNILQALMGNVEFLKDDLPPGSQSFSDLGEIEKGCRRAATLTRQLLAFSRRQVMRPRRLDLNNLVSDVMKMLHRLIGENIELVFRSSDTPLIVYGDQSQMEQIVLNLAVNARDAMPEGGQITIRTQRVIVADNARVPDHAVLPGEYAMLSVSDTGAGMDEETKQRIFEPFFTTKGKSDGTGLGLSTVYGIVTQHGGLVRVESAVGAGAVFDVYLPITRGLAAPEPDEERTSAVTGCETVLLAEDDDGVRKMVAKMLSEAGYHVLTARDGGEAVRQFAKHRDEIHLVILDVVMPVKSGKAALEDIRKTSPGVRALFVSGYPETGIHKRHVLEEGLDLLQKPFSRCDLLETVRTILDRDH